MAHLSLPTESPGLIGLYEYRPDTARAMAALTETLMRGESPLPRGDRELIAALVSSRNACRFCTDAHACFAELQVKGGTELVEQVLDDYRTAPITPKLKALLHIAELTNESGLSVTPEAIRAARTEGATDREIHDTVLIAALYAMFNRYIDGLATWTPEDRAAHRPAAGMIVEQGYVAIVEHILAGPPAEGEVEASSE
jgi:uncharacterized peroxidase-related enzyme